MKNSRKKKANKTSRPKRKKPSRRPSRRVRSKKTSNSRKPKRETIAQQAKRRGVSQNRIKRERFHVRQRTKEAEGAKKYGSVKAYHDHHYKQFVEQMRGTPFHPDYQPPKEDKVYETPFGDIRVPGTNSRRSAPRVHVDPRVRDKICKVRALAASPNAHEAALAQQRAKEIAAAHGLSESDVVC